MWLCVKEDIPYCERPGKREGPAWTWVTCVRHPQTRRLVPGAGNLCNSQPGAEGTPSRREWVLVSREAVHKGSQTPVAPGKGGGQCLPTCVHETEVNLKCCSSGTILL